MAEPAKKAQAKPATPPEKRPEVKPQRELLPASESSDGAVQQLIALRSIAAEIGQTERVEKISEQLTELGYK